MSGHIPTWVRVPATSRPITLRPSASPGHLHLPLQTTPAPELRTPAALLEAASIPSGNVFWPEIAHHDHLFPVTIRPFDLAEHPVKRSVGITVEHHDLFVLDDVEPLFFFGLWW